MSNHAWVRRRTKKGLAARQYAAIQRAMRRDKNKPLPLKWTSRGAGGVLLTVTVGARADDDFEDYDDGL